MSLQLPQFKDYPNACKPHTSFCEYCRRSALSSWRASQTGESEFQCPHGLPDNYVLAPINVPIVVIKKPIPEVAPMDAVTNVLNAVKSVVTTTVGINVASKDQIDSRIGVCKNCPSGVVKLAKDGSVYTCGTMVNILKSRGEAPCGCILSLKAKDKTQVCPFGHWNTVDEQFK